VTDDGIGIGPGAAFGGPGATHRGLGLSSMRERAEALGGALRVLPAPAGGTTVEVTLPAA
jgi:signal transduction histidine kinase